MSFYSTFLLDNKFIINVNELKICRIFNEQIRIVRNRLQGKPAFFLNTFPKARLLKVCILLCIPVRDIYPEQWSVQGRNNSLSAQHSSNPPQEKRSCGVRTQHDSRIREVLPSHVTRRISITHSCRTADSPFHDPPGISAFFSPAPESASPNACLGIFREIRGKRCVGFSLFFKYIKSILSRLISIWSPT